MNKPKNQGTKAETRIVRLHEDHGLSARRLAEGGRNDLGDVEIRTSADIDDPYSVPLFGEVKDRERLNLHDALDKAMAKSGTHRTAVFWTKRSMANSTAGVRRSQTQRLVAIPEEFWLELIGGSQHEE